jgi:hypothetical protein
MQGSIREIRVTCPAVALAQADPWFLRFLHFPHNLQLVSVLYSGERPDITPHDEESKKAKTTELKQKETTTMKTKLTKMIMSSLAFGCASVCLAAAMTLSTSATAQAAADRHCSVGTLRGLYLWTLEGYQNFGGNPVPKDLMQGTRFNGNGTLINEFGTVNIGGFIVIDVSGSGGTYTVAPDCTGTISITDGPTFNMYIGPGAQQLSIINTGGGPGDGTGLGLGTATRLP